MELIYVVQSTSVSKRDPLRLGKTAAASWVSHLGMTCCKCGDTVMCMEWLTLCCSAQHVWSLLSFLFLLLLWSHSYQLASVSQPTNHLSHSHRRLNRTLRLLLLCTEPSEEEVEVEVALRLTVGQSICLGVEPTLGLATRYYLLFGCWQSCGLVSVGRPLWREDGYAICSAITQWSESRRTRLRSRYDWRSVSQSVCLGVGNPIGAHDQILLFPFLWRKIALLFVLGRPLWREDGSVICCAICQWSESRRTHNHTLLSLLGSLFIASYDSAGIMAEVSLPSSTWGGGLRSRYD
jgi:hypothetical protein